MSGVFPVPPAWLNAPPAPDPPVVTDGLGAHGPPAPPPAAAKPRAEESVPLVPGPEEPEHLPVPPAPATTG